MKIGTSIAITGVRGAAGPPPWTPSDLAGLALQLQPTLGTYQDAARATAAVGGEPLGGWADQSSAGHHGAQSNSARRPFVRTSGLGGGARPYIDFDGANDGILLSGWGLGSGAQTVAIEFARRSNPTAQRLFSVRQAGPVFSAISFINFQGYGEIICRFGGASGTSVGFTPGLGTGRHTLLVCYDGSGPGSTSAYAVYLDGVAAIMTTSGSFPDDPLMGCLGSYSDGSIPAAVDLGRIACWTADHRTNAASIVGWLNA